MRRTRLQVFLVVAILGSMPCHGQNDVVFGNAPGKGQTCLGNGVGKLTCGGSLPSGVQDLEMGFINRDDHLDVVMAREVSDASERGVVCLGDGFGNFMCNGITVNPLGTYGYYGVALGYVDGDANLDAIFTSCCRETNRVCLGNGNGGFTCSDVSPHRNYGRDVAVGYVDADSHLDAVFATSSENRICLGDGHGSFSCNNVSNSVNETGAVALGLFDGDQNLDVVFGNTSADSNRENRICLGNGQGGFLCSSISSDANYTNGVGLGAINGDSHLDIIFANRNQRNRVCLGNGSGSFACHDVSDEANQSLDVALGYVDGDSNLDAIFANGQESGKTNRICLGNGRGGFTCSVDLNEPYNTVAVAIGDVDTALLFFADGFESGDPAAWHSVRH